MSFLLSTNLRLAADNLRKNRGRTLLSALGIAIGVASIVLVFSLTGGINRLINASSDRNNANLILVRPTSGKKISDNIINELTASNQYAKSNLTLNDVDVIKKIDNISSVCPLAISTANLKIGDRSAESVNILATTPNFAKSANLSLKNGQFLESSFQDGVAVLGYKAALSLFGSPDILTKTFSYNNQHFMVVGVLDEINDPINYNNIDLDNSIIVNIAFVSTFEKSLQIQQINVRTNNSDSVSTVSQKIQDSLSANKSGSSDFTIVNDGANLHPAGSLLSIISSMLTIIASISLIVGGIGIMNIMLVSVSERTREIGIRKAVGASAGNILTQFLFESIILSLLGGIIGFILGYIFAFLISLITPFAPYISWQILCTTSVVTLLTGIVFGVYPASKAALKDPISSLKYYR